MRRVARRIGLERRMTGYGFAEGILFFFITSIRILSICRIIHKFGLAYPALGAAVAGIADLELERTLQREAMHRARRRPAYWSGRDHFIEAAESDVALAPHPENARVGIEATFDGYRIGFTVEAVACFHGLRETDCFDLAKSVVPIAPNEVSIHPE